MSPSIRVLSLFTAYVFVGALLLLGLGSLITASIREHAGVLTDEPYDALENIPGFLRPEAFFC